MLKSIRIIVTLFLVAFTVGCVENGDAAPGPEPKDIEKQDQLYTDDEKLNTDESDTDDNEIKTLLTDELKNVEELGVLYPYYHREGWGYIEVRYNTAKDKDKIEQIFQSIKVTEEEYHKIEPLQDGQLSNPTFIINIYYSSGAVDEIASTETGEYIFRNTSTKNPSFVGGNNTELQKLLGDGSELYSTEYEKLDKSIKDMLVAFQNNIKNGNKQEIANLITANVTEDDYKNLKEGKLDDYGAVIHYQNGDISIDAFNRKSDRYEFMTFRFVKVEDQLKLDSLEYITRVY